jgi:hypothetical protein
MQMYTHPTRYPIRRHIVAGMSGISWWDEISRVRGISRETAGMAGISRDFIGGRNIPKRTGD